MHFRKHTVNILALVCLKNQNGLQNGCQKYDFELKCSKVQFETTVWQSIVSQKKCKNALKWLQNTIYPNLSQREGFWGIG